MRWRSGGDGLESAVVIRSRLALLKGGAVTPQSAFRRLPRSPDSASFILDALDANGLLRTAIRCDDRYCFENTSTSIARLTTSRKPADDS